MKKMKTKVLSVTMALCIVMSSISVAVPMNTTTVEAKAYVYVAASGNGECYHSSKNCSRMRGRVAKMTKKAAKKQGYRACKKCYR